MIDKPAQPLVSMCCLTFNHADTIAKCLDSMLMQKTSFPVEIVVHDDASTDGTAEIVADYAARHPGLIRAILQSENQYSRGVHPVVLLFEAARGDFVAVCEGDDFWTDPEKIELQEKILREYPGADICGHASWIRSGPEGSMADKASPSYPEGIYSGADILLKDSITVQTATLFFRRSVIDPFAQFMRMRRRNVGDIYLKVLGARRGGLFYLARPMSVYRRGSAGSWSASVIADHRSSLESAQSKIDGLSDLLRVIGPTLDGAVLTVNARTVLWILRSRHVPLSRRIAFVSRNLPVGIAVRKIVRRFLSRRP